MDLPDTRQLAELMQCEVAIGIKIFGNDLKTLEEVSRTIAEVVRKIPGAKDVYPEQISGAPYIDIHINRTAAARYGIDPRTIEDVIEPFLIQQGFMMRTPRGRIATKNAYLHFGLTVPEKVSLQKNLNLLEDVD